MTKHLLLKIAIGFFAVLGIITSCLISIWIYTEYSLYRYCHFIEKNYSKEIAMIEHKCNDFTEDDEYSQTSIEELEAILELHRETYKMMDTELSAPEIYNASWSNDGHHGARTLHSAEKDWRLATYPFPSFKSDENHSTCWGETKDGRTVVVFIGKVPNGKKYRHYEVFFLTDKLDSIMRK
jgi:hypothetical protein